VCCSAVQSRCAQYAGTAGRFRSACYMHVTDVNMYVTDANMHVTYVNMHVTYVNMHVTDVNMHYSHL
jgi:hypothetical protein